MESTKEDLIKRLFSNTCKIPIGQILDGGLNEKWQVQIDHCMAAINEAPLYIDDTASVSVTELSDRTRKLVADKNVKLVIIDYLQLMVGDGSQFDSRLDEEIMILMSLKKLAAELSIPILVLSHPLRDDKQVSISQHTQYEQLENIVDVSLAIHRPEYKDETGDNMCSIAQLIIAKNKNGVIGSVWMTYQNKYLCFQTLKDKFSV